MNMRIYDSRVRGAHHGMRQILVAALVVAITAAAMCSAKGSEGFVFPEARLDEQIDAATRSGAELPATNDPFFISVSFGVGLTPSQQAIFTTAADTWDAVIAGYQQGISINGPLISASAIYIDGPGGILGQAGPTLFTHQGGYWLATQGVMQFDADDVVNLENNGSLLEVILHEMGHVLGIGTLWDPVFNDVYEDGTGQYTGAAGLAAYQSEFDQPGATFVPVELGGGAGTVDAHWDEKNGGGSNTGIASNISGQDMRFELMTGWINRPTFMSSLSVQSLVDIGFEVETPSFAPEDLNGDGFVDSEDIGILLLNWDSGVLPSQGELDGQAPVNSLDLGILLIAWDAPLAPASAMFVPEPTAGVILLIAVLACALPRSRAWLRC